MPEPGEKKEDISHGGDGGGVLIYDALVFGACEGFPLFPVDHTATITGPGNVDFGEFMGTDNSTLNATGFYNVNYTVRADDGNGNVSDFVFAGKANVVCSALNALP